MRVLVADDELEMAVVLQALLEREHFSVDTVYSGPDALAYGLAENYDCLVLDIMMPGLDGIQVLEALRRKNISTPVLLLTAKSQVEDRIAGLNSGADDYLPKPSQRGVYCPGTGSDRRGRDSHPAFSLPAMWSWTAPPLSSDAEAPPSGWPTRSFKCWNCFYVSKDAPFPQSSSWSASGL